jgi:hypothetical protein
MAFYLIRGIFLLLFDFLKGLRKKKPAAPPPRPGGGAGPAGGSGGSPPGGGGPPAAPAAPSAAPTASASGGATSAAPAAEAGPAPVGQAPAAAVSERTAPPLEAASEAPAESTSAVAPKGDGQGRSPSVGRQAAESQEAPRPPAAARHGASEPARSEKTTRQTRAKAEVPQATLVQKKAPRRGIRLKVDGGQGPEFD